MRKSLILESMLKLWRLRFPGGTSPVNAGIAVPDDVPTRRDLPSNIMNTIRLGSQGPDVTSWQQIIGVTADGIFGPNTEAATKLWQSQHGLTADGIVGPQTWAAAAPKSSPTVGGIKIAKVPGIENLSQAELRAGIDAAKWIGIDPNWLFTAMGFETAHTFSPSIVNRAGSGAVGLIQFTPPTAQALGTTTAALKQMSFIEQLQYVKKYFEPVRGKLHSLNDVYLRIFYPKYIGSAGNTVIAQSGSAVYSQNVGFDHDNKGYITVDDVTRAINSLYQQALDNGFIVVTAGVSLFAILALGAVGAYLYYRTKL